MPVSGSGRAARRAASGAGTPSRPQDGLGELIHGGLIDAFRVPLGKQFKPALTADAAVRAIAGALAAAGLPEARATAAHEDGRLVVTVTGADPGRVRDAVAGFALTVHSGPSPAAQTTSK